MTPETATGDAGPPTPLAVGADAEAVLAAVGDAVREGLLVLGADRRVAAANGALYRMLGTAPGEVAGRSVYDLGGGAWDVPALRALLEAPPPASGASDGLELTLGAGTGRERHVVLNARWLDGGRVALAVEDVTERRAYARGLEESEERFRQAVGAADLGTWVYDLRGRTTRFDARVRAIFGVGEGEVEPQDVVARIHPDDLEGFFRAREQALAPDTPDTFAETHRVVRSDGAVRWVRGQARVYFEDDGAGGRRPTHVAGVVSDVTEQREAEDALRRLNETLEARVEERTREVREQGARVRALARALTLAEQEERRRIAHVLHDDLQQVLVGARLIGARGDLARLGDVLGQAAKLTQSLSHELAPPLLRSDDVGSLLEWLAERAGAVYGLEVDLDVRGAVSVPDEPVRVLLYQVLRELLFNAVKHAGTGRVRLAASAARAATRVVVEDDGVGFDVDELSRRRAGGLGLPSVRERLELVGGRLAVASAPGEGTRVTVEVPSAPAAS